MRSYRLPLKELRELQDRKVRWLAHYVYRHVPLYRERFRSVGLTPEDIRGAEDLRRLPVLSKEEVREKYSRMIAVGKDPSRSIRQFTSGSTGPPLAGLRDVSLCDVNFGVSLRRDWLCGIRPWHKAARIIFAGPEEDALEANSRHSIAFALSRMITGPWNPRLKVFIRRTLGFRTCIGEVGLGLLAFRPDFLSSRPSYLLSLADWLEDRGEELHVRLIFCEGEFLSRRARAEIVKKYGAEVFNNYGSIELGGLGAECREHSGIHLNSDFFIFEFIRDGEPVSPGERGEVIVTGLHNETMPLIRYEMGDIAVPEDNVPCPCGSCLPRIRAIEGRKDDGLILKNGTRIPLGIIVDHIENVIGLRQYQVIQGDHDEVLMKLKAAEASPQAVHALSSYLKGLLGEDLMIKTEVSMTEYFPVKNRPVVTQLS